MNTETILILKDFFQDGNLTGGLSTALEVWDTNQRLSGAASGGLSTPDQKRLCSLRSCP